MNYGTPNASAATGTKTGYQTRRPPQVYVLSVLTDAPVSVK